MYKRIFKYIQGYYLKIHICNFNEKKINNKIQFEQILFENKKRLKCI